MALGSVLGGLGAVASAAGGIASLFQKKKKPLGPEGQINFQYKSYLKQIQGITDAAKMYGFHPLALLGSAGGGGSSFAQPVGGDGGSYFAGDVVGDALRSVGGYMEQDADRADADRDRRNQLREVNYQHMRDTIADTIGAKSRVAQDRSQALQDDYTRALIEQVRSRTAIDNARALSIGAAPPSRVLHNFMGDDVPTTAGVDDAQLFENRYGDIVSEMYGIGNWIRDHFGASSIRIKKMRNVGPGAILPPPLY